MVCGKAFKNNCIDKKEIMNIFMMNLLMSILCSDLPNWLILYVLMVNVWTILLLESNNGLYL